MLHSAHQAFYWSPCAIHIPRVTWIVTPWVRRVHVDAPFFFAESLTDDCCAQIVVHYFEDGNVQLNTTKTFEHSTASSVCVQGSHEWSSSIIYGAETRHTRAIVRGEYCILKLIACFTEREGPGG
jgi:hypothetical protein